jgi:hypothetical protein
MLHSLLLMPPVELEIMARRPDPLNHIRLVERVLEFGEEAIREILQRLRVRQNATFLELAVRVLFKSGLGCFDEVCDIVDKGPRRACQISRLCMLSGFSCSKKETPLCA